MRKSFWISIFALGLANFVPPAARADETVFGTYGGHLGDHQDRVRCPAGSALQGFTGRYGTWVDRIQMLCAPAEPNGEFGQPVATGPEFGGEGGARQDVYCPRGTYFSGAEYMKTVGDRQVANIAMTCRSIATGTTQTIVFGQAGYRIVTTGIGVGNPASNLPPPGSNGLHHCPGGQVAIGFDVAWGKDVNAVGLICNTVAHPAAVAAASAKPIKSVRRSPATQAAPAPSGPPLAPRGSIGGKWKLTLGESERYNLDIFPQVQNGGIGPLGGDTLPFPVAINLVNADGSPELDGTFNANMMPDRQLMGGYGQKNGDSGQCLLTYTAEGNMLVGECSRNKGRVHWAATRGSWPVAAAADPPRADRAALHTVTVKLDVDLYAQPGGAGQPTGQLGAGTDNVELVQACQNDWCHVRWPGHEGWVYSGADYNSLGQ